MRTKMLATACLPYDLMPIILPTVLLVQRQVPCCLLGGRTRRLAVLRLPFVGCLYGADVG